LRRWATCDHMDAVCESLCVYAWNASIDLCCGYLPEPTCGHAVSLLLTGRVIVHEIGWHSPRTGELKDRYRAGMDGLAIWRYVFQLSPPRQITNPQLLDSPFELLPRNQGMPTPRPSAAPHLLGPCKCARTPAILYDPGCRLHIVRCEPRCALHVSAVVIRCKSSLSRIASPTLQDTCRFARCLSVYLGPGDAPCQSTISQSAVATFMAHSCQSKIKTPCFPVAGKPDADKSWVSTSLPVGLLSVDGAWRLFLYVCVCCRDGYLHCICSRLGSTMPSRCPSIGS
jgi:hypothetical protein